MKLALIRRKNKLYMIIILLILPYVGYSQVSPVLTKFILDGYIHGSEYKKVYLIYTTGIIPHVIRDTSTLSNKGYFKFTGTVSEPTMAFFLGKMKSNSIDDPNFNSFFLEAGHVRIDGRENMFKNMRISGSIAQDVLEKLKEKKEDIFKQIESDSINLYKYMHKYHIAIQNNSDSAKLNSLKRKTFFIRSILNRHNFEYNTEDIRFIKTHPNSYVSAYLLDNDMLMKPLDTLMGMYKILSKRIQMSRYGKDIFQHIQKIRQGLPGNEIKDFFITDLKDHQLKSSAFNSKFILLDFWDSWCIPCRLETPLLLKLYNKYHHNGLEIIGIAGYEPDSSIWRNAIIKDGTQQWHQILDKKDTGSNDIEGVISNQFGIYVIPSQILINPNGVIIGRYGGNTKYTLKNLQKKLNQIFENK